MMNRFLDIIKGIGLASLILTVCYFGCYKNIDTYSEWAKDEYNRLTDNYSDRVFYTRFDMDKVYDEYLEILNKNQYFTPTGDYNASFKYELRDEVKVSEHQSLGKPKGKSIVFTGSFGRYATGALKLGVSRFDLDGYVENLEYIIDKIDDVPDKTPEEYAFVSFLRIQFDYIYIAYEDGSILRCIDLQEVLWRDND